MEDDRVMRLIWDLLGRNIQYVAIRLSMYNVVELVIWCSSLSCDSYFYLKCPIYPFSEVDRNKLGISNITSIVKVERFELKFHCSCKFRKWPNFGKIEIIKVAWGNMFQQMLKHGIGCCQKLDYYQFPQGG